MIKPPPESLNYFQRKVPRVLAGENPVIHIELWGGKWNALVEIESKPGDDEKRCLKVMHAFAHDPQIPEVDQVYVFMVTYGKWKEIEPLKIRFIPTYATEMEQIGTFGTEMEQINYGCIIKRDALLRGEEPTWFVQHGIQVNGRGLLSLSNGNTKHLTSGRIGVWRPSEFLGLYGDFLD
jgi:hypothetical protein